MYELVSKQDKGVLSTQEQDELNTLQQLDNTPEVYDVEEDEEI